MKIGLKFLFLCTFFLSKLSTAEHYQVCDQLEMPADLPTAFFESTMNEWVSAMVPYHSANDILISVGQDAIIEGKFSYGAISKNLENEAIQLWMDGCGEELVYLEKVRTNSDGRSKAIIQASNFLEPGAYQIYQRVLGDGTFTKSMLRILPKASKIAIFDIDGTLTVSDSELFKYLNDDSYVPQERNGAIQLTRFLYRVGYEIVYLTGRHYLLTEHSRNWLKAKEFAPGTVLFSQSISESWPGKSGVGKFKIKYLIQYQESGFQIKHAYGNAMTDIFAYEEANIQKSRTFILGENGGKKGTIDLGQDFAAHLKNLTNGGNGVHE